MQTANNTESHESFLILTLIFTIYDFKEEAIRKMIESSPRMNGEQNNNPAINKHAKGKKSGAGGIWTVKFSFNNCCPFR
jgi:hypothetical protein